MAFRRKGVEILGDNPVHKKECGPCGNQCQAQKNNQAKGYWRLCRRGVPEDRLTFVTFKLFGRGFTSRKLPDGSTAWTDDCKRAFVPGTRLINLILGRGTFGRAERFFEGSSRLLR